MLKPQRSKDLRAITIFWINCPLTALYVVGIVVSGFGMRHFVRGLQSGENRQARSKTAFSVGSGVLRERSARPVG